MPLPVQQPRPPLTIAAHGPKMLRIVADPADRAVAGNLVAAVWSVQEMAQEQKD